MNPFGGDSSTRSSSDLRRSLVASSMISDSTDPFTAGGPPVQQEQEDIDDLQGKIVDYLTKLNDILKDYERQRVIESALLNLQKFNTLLQAFMDLPEVE